MYLSAYLFKVSLYLGSQTWKDGNWMSDKTEDWKDEKYFPGSLDLDDNDNSPSEQVIVNLFRTL